MTLREYVDVNHNLTAWGKMLVTVITALKGNSDLEEAALVAVELIRLGLLSSNNMFPYSGAPMRGEREFHYQLEYAFANYRAENDRDFNLLISRVGGLGTLHHNEIGFTGPLSQHLLGYNSIINAVRSTVRDLMEVSATHLFMAGFAKRDITNMSEIALQ